MMIRSHKFLFASAVIPFLFFIPIFFPVSMVIAAFWYAVYKNSVIMFDYDYIKISRGIFYKETICIPKEKVNNVRFRTGILGRLVGYGTIEIFSGNDLSKIDFSFFPILNISDLKRWGYYCGEQHIEQNI